MDLSIIIVSWNVRDRLRENLQSLFKAISYSGFKVEVFVVDNDSRDGTTNMLNDEFPSIKVIINKENLGFSRANNQALKRASGDFVLLLNPDMVVFEDTIKNMMEWMRTNPQASLAGCKLVNEKGELVNHARRFPQVFDQLAIVLKLPHFLPFIINSYLRKDFDYTQAQKVDSIRGGFFFMRRDVLERIGLLDERYFLWFEEVDYCKRVGDKKHGGYVGEVWYTPAAQCIDCVGQSFSQLKRSKAQNYFKDSQLKYFFKWHPVWQYYLLKVAWVFSSLIVWGCEKIDYKSKAKT